MRTITSKFNFEDYAFELGKYENKEVIFITFPYNQKLIKHLKEHTKARWCKEKKRWYVFDNKYYRELFDLPFKYFSNSLYKNILPVNQSAFKNLINQLELKGYSKNTIRTYANEFAQLLKTIKGFNVNDLTAEKLRSYFLFCIKKQKLSEGTIHSRMNSIKFYFEQVLHRERLFFDIPRPKKPSTLPKALSTNDIRKMFGTLKNQKHRLLMKLCYGMGLRVSELVNLKITDIDSSRMQVLVSSGKGKKDRYVVLPESILSELREYYLAYHPKEYLFEGQHGGQYSPRSAQMVFKTAMKTAHINKRVGVHSLRHSYATHLVEQGVDIRFVQDLLGHKNIKTTMAYTHLTDQSRRKIKSPLDNF